MSLDYLKVNVDSLGKVSDDSSPEDIYRIYSTNPDFLSYFSDVLTTCQRMIHENFPDINVSVHGRIKAKNSYLQKSDLKNNNVFDIYAFKIILSGVDRNCSREISDFLVSDNSLLLHSTHSTNLPERSKDYEKDNGYRAHHRTLHNEDLNCFVEFQCCSEEEHRVNCENHREFKENKYNVEINFPDYAISSLKELEKYNEEYLPTFVYIKDNKLVKCPAFINFIYYFKDYLFEQGIDENDNSFLIHNDKLSIINNLASEYTKNKVHEPEEK